VKLERRSELSVPVLLEGRPASRDELAAWLLDPPRLLQQLLSGEQLEVQASGQFLYFPRPLQLPGILIAPQVHFRADGQASLLAISLIDYRLPGLAALERNACYRFSAELQAVDGAFRMRAKATLTLNIGGGGLGMPEPLLAFLGNRALGLIFGRLEQRCRRNLGSRLLPGS